MNVPTREGQAGEGVLNLAFRLPQPERGMSPSFLPVPVLCPRPLNAHLEGQGPTLLAGTNWNFRGEGGW